MTQVSSFWLQKQTCLTEANGPVSVGVEELERGPVERVRHAQPPLERLELLEGDEPVLGRVEDAAQKLGRVLVVAGLGEQAEVPGK